MLRKQKLLVVAVSGIFCCGLGLGTQDAVGYPDEKCSELLKECERKKKLLDDCEESKMDCKRGGTKEEECEKTKTECQSKLENPCEVWRSLNYEGNDTGTDSFDSCMEGNVDYCHYGASECMRMVDPRTWPLSDPEPTDDPAIKRCREVNQSCMKEWKEGYDDGDDGCNAWLDYNADVEGKGTEFFNLCVQEIAEGNQKYEWVTPVVGCLAALNACEKGVAAK